MFISKTVSHTEFMNHDSKIFYRLLVLVIIVSGTISLSAQEKIKWMSWEEAVKKNETEQRKIFVDIYTDWCGWCKKMDKATFQNASIAKYMNENYYAVKFNAEQKETIVFRGKEYNFVKNGRKGYNQLAAELTQGRLSYPTIVFLDENINIIQPIPGFRAKDEFEMMMTFFAEDFYKDTPWQSYTRAYTPMSKKASSKYSRTVSN